MAQTVDAVKFKINPEYDELLPKLSIEEYEALKLSIKTEGQHYPIIVNGTFDILDGHHRARICEELGLKPRFEVKTFANKLLEKKFVIEANLHRRHLNDFQRATLVLPLLEIEKELAKQRQEATQFKEGNGVPNIWHTEQPQKAKKTRKPLTTAQKQRNNAKRKAKREADKKAGIVPKKKVRATEVVSKKAGLSHTQLEKTKTIREKGSKELQARVESGQTSISYAYKIVKRDERKTNQQPLPTNEFDVIYADPPWAYDLDLRGDPQEHYNVMGTDKICKLAVPSAKDAILFLWATNPKLKEALDVISAWGFTYKTNLVWVKNKFGTGYYFRGQHELLLLAVKGNIGCPIEKDRPSSVLMATVEKHSQKPGSVREMIEQMYPNHKYLELFAREKVKGWKSWGNEVKED